MKKPDVSAWGKTQEMIIRTISMKTKFIKSWLFLLKLQNLQLNRSVFKLLKLFANLHKWSEEEQVKFRNWIKNLV